MADDATTQADPETGSEQTAEHERPRQELPPEVAAALKKANKEAETLRHQLKEYEDRDKTEAEKLAERATEAERRAAEAETRLERRDVALAKGLPADLVDRLQGATRDELEADADKLLALLKPTETSGKAQAQRAISGAQGRRETAKPEAGAAGRAEAQKRFRKSATT